MLYERALQLESRSVEARNNLGNAYLELGQFGDAARCFRLAVEIKPDDAQIACNLGVALRRCGQPEEAADCFRQALALDPGSVDALNNLGDVLREVGLRREAVPLYTRAVELDPQRVVSHWNLGTALFELRRTNEAAASYHRALALKPDYAPAHLSLGLALRQQRRPADAEASCLAALAIDPNSVEALSFLGELRADRGGFAEAEALFQRTLAINPEFSFAYFSIATHRKMTREDGAWLQGAEGLLSKRQPLANEISLRYALGKYYDDVREFDAAFGNYRQANELTKRYGSTYDRQKFTQRVDQIIRRFDAAALSRDAHPGASLSERPVFIVGMPRSGTSLTEQILASHPSVFGAGELPFWDVAFAAHAKAELAGEDAGPLLSGVTADYLRRLTLLDGTALRVVDKMPANFLYAGLIHAAFPRARILHMQRHPIDTCLSIYFQNFFSMGPYANDLENLAHYYGEYDRITDHWRSTLPASAWLDVPYEALIADQEGWTRRMLDFVGLPWDARCLDFHQTDRAVITASKWQVRQKINPTAAGRWRNYQKFLGPLLRLLDPAAH